MKKERLIDYAVKENDLFEKHMKNAVDSTELLQYPPKDRFLKLNEPLVFFDPFSYFNYKEKIWFQIPFAGTLMISLRNVPQNDCLNYHSFEPNEISQLIELAKDKGKIQFGLQTLPTEYENLDYLDDIFNELNPPVLFTQPFESLADNKILDKWRTSFDQHASISYYEAFEKIRQIPSPNYVSNLIEQHRGIYLSLKLLQWDNAIENLENVMIDDPILAMNLFEKYAILIGPKFASFTPNVSWGLKELKRFDLDANSLSNTFYPEIGSYILKQTMLHPFDYHECRSVIDHYDQNQLYTVYKSLYRSVQNQTFSDLTENIESIKEIMDNAWADGSKLVGKNKTIKIALDVVLGLCGAAASTLAGVGYPGLLAGLGFGVLTNNTPWSSGLSEKILKHLQPDYLVNIYDFQQQTK